MTITREFTYPSSDGIHQIHAREWAPEGTPRAVLQIAHGLADHIGWYAHVGQFLAAQGILVCGNDHLGHGKTAGEEGPFGYFASHDGWTLATADLRILRKLQGEKYPGIPYFLMGHSMGSFLVRTYLCRYPGEVDGAVISGTGQEPALLVAACKLLSGLLCRLRGGTYISPLILALSLGAYNKKFTPARTPSDWLSRDEASVDACLADPLRAFLPTVGLYRDMMGGLQYISNPKKLAQMDPCLPVYFFSGDCDPVGSMGKGVKKVVSMFEKAGCRDVTLKLYPGGRHEMVNEINREEVLADLLDWLERKI